MEKQSYNTTVGKLMEWFGDGPDWDKDWQLTNCMSIDEGVHAQDLEYKKEEDDEEERWNRTIEKALDVLAYLRHMENEEIEVSAFNGSASWEVEFELDGKKWSFASLFAPFEYDTGFDPNSPYITL